MAFGVDRFELWMKMEKFLVGRLRLLNLVRRVFGFGVRVRVKDIVIIWQKERALINYGLSWRRVGMMRYGCVCCVYVPRR